MRTVEIHVSDETARVIEKVLRESGRGIAIERAKIHATEAVHRALGCTDPECDTETHLKRMRESVEEMETLERFFIDVASSLKCADRCDQGAAEGNRA